MREISGRPLGHMLRRVGNVARRSIPVWAAIAALAPAAALAGVTVSHFAGYAPGFLNGTGIAAKFSYVPDVAVDSQGNVYVPDELNAVIRKITPAQVVTTYAGTGVAGIQDGPIATARFNNPQVITIDAADNIYVLDSGDVASQFGCGKQRLRKITPAGVVSTVAGSGATGFADGQGAAARFSCARGMGTDSAGNIYVADSANNAIRKVTPAGYVTTFAGIQPSSGVAMGYADGPAVSALFCYPWDVAVDAGGNLFVADTCNNRIRKITQGGMVSTFAGSGLVGWLAISGWADGPPMTAKFFWPKGIAIDGAGTLYVADFTNHRIRTVSPSGNVSTLAGTGQPVGSNGTVVDGDGTVATFDHPFAIAALASGQIEYVTEDGAYHVRKIAADPGRLKICKVAGPGVSPGATFGFYANGSSLSVPAGPGPGGTCVVGPSYTPGTAVLVSEAIPPGYSVSNIAVAPADRLTGALNLLTGKVNITVGSGVTEVTYTDKRPTGFLEICKSVVGGPQPSAESGTFSVNPGALGPFTVRSGTCSAAIEVAAGSVLITEAAPALMSGCSTFPATRQGACNLGVRKSTVTVPAGDISTQTIAYITNNASVVINPNGIRPIQDGTNPTK